MVCWEALRVGSSGEGGDDAGVAMLFDDGFEAVAAVAEWEVEEEFALGVEEVEDHEDGGNLGAEFVRDFLAADAGAEDGEGEGVGDGFGVEARQKSQARISPSRMRAPSWSGGRGRRLRRGRGRIR